MSIEVSSYHTDEDPSKHEHGDEKSLNAVMQSLERLQLDDAVLPLDTLDIEGSIDFKNEDQLKEFLKNEAVTVSTTAFIGRGWEDRELSFYISIDLPNDIVIHGSIINLSEGTLARFKLILKQLLSEQVSSTQFF
jgi:hypothetical protein